MDRFPKTEEFALYDKQVSTKIHKYERGKVPDLNKIRNPKFRETLKNKEKIFKQAAIESVRSELLLPSSAGHLSSSDGTPTWKYTQKDIQKQANILTQHKIFSLSLNDYGAYKARYSRNGRHLLLGGSKGHLAMMDWHKSNLICEVFSDEMVHDITFLHNETMFATGQRSGLHIYNHSGTELHRISQLGIKNFCSLDFLPYHFLIVSGTSRTLAYLDSSIGKCIFEEKVNDIRILKQNPWNAIIHVGHTDGTVTLWSPNSKESLVKMFCHEASVTDLAIDKQGRLMVTAGMDNKLKIWDNRKYQPLSEYVLRSPIKRIDLSQLGLLALGFNAHVEIWNNLFSTESKPQEPYLMEKLFYPIHSVRFCPYEDVLGVGTLKSFHSMIVPGAGEPNFDSLEVNPFISKKSRANFTVQQLLDKVQPELITLNPDVIGSAIPDRNPEAIHQWHNQVQKELDKSKPLKKKVKKSRKQLEDEKRFEVQRKRIIEKKQERKDKIIKEKASGPSNQPPKVPTDVLDRFKRKERPSKEKEENLPNKRQKFA